MFKNNTFLKSKNIKLIILLFFVGLSCVFGYLFLNAISAKATSEPIISNYNLKSEYAVGSKIAISTSSISVAGKEYTVQPTVYFPDGSACRDTEIVLDCSGEYILEYSVVENDKYYSLVKSFRAYDYIVSNDTTGEPLKYLTNYNYGGENGLTGLAFSTRPSEKINFNNIIDLSNATADDVLISMEGTPKNAGFSQARTIFVRLTDIYDSSNFITTRIRRVPREGSKTDKDFSTVAACFGKEIFSGWADTGLETGDTWTTPTRNGFTGVWETGHNAIELYYDYASSSLYTRYGNSKRLVVDFKNDFKTKWKGFTTGEVFLSIWAEDYSGTESPQMFNGMILDVYGCDISKNIDTNGTISVVKVEQAPNFSIDFGSYDCYDNIPNAMVGCPYNIYPYVTSSIYVDNEAEVKVYYGYYSSSKYSLQISNNSFIPINDGMHTIEYTLKDRFGNISTKFVDVYAVKNAGYTFNLNLSDYEKYSKGLIGKECAVLSVSELSYTENVGNVDFKVIAKHSSGIEIDVVNDAFTPIKGGEWKIIYKGTDAVGRTAESSYDINIQVGDEVHFYEIKDLNKYLIVGAKNPIPNLQVIDYTNNNEIKDVEKTYVEFNGAYVCDVTDGYFIPSQEGVYDIIYKATSSRQVTSLQKYSIKAVDVGFTDELVLQKYFVSDELISAESDDSQIILNLKSNAKVDFIRPIDAYNFTMSFNIGGNLSNVSGFNLVLTDVNNKNQCVNLKFVKINNDVALAVNGGEQELLDNYKFGDGSTFDLSIKNKTISLGANSLLIDKFASGVEFIGFESNLVNVTFEFISDTNQDEVKLFVSEITGQKFNDMTIDGMEPRIINTANILSTYVRGQEVNILPITIVDVLDPYTTVVLTVEGPDNKPITDKNGKKLEKVSAFESYIIVPNDMGTYRIKYIYLDSNKNGTTIGRGKVFKLISRDKPDIQLDTSVVTVKKGEKVKIRDITIDSLSSNCSIYIFIKAKDSAYKQLENDGAGYVKETRFNEKGIYKVRYVVMDEWNNLNFAEYEIRVV